MPWLGYCRVSKVGERGERLLSPELQAERIRGYASAHGLTVEMLEAELDVSGATLERPILSAALARIDRGEAEGIIVAQLDRLSRAGILDTHVILRRVAEAGGALISVAENFDGSTVEGRLARNLMLDVGEMQRERIREGFEAARRSAVARGIWPGAHVPVGYVKGGDRRLVVDDPERVVRAFEARAGGASWGEVGRILGLAASGAQYAISNRVYLGEVRMKVGGEVVVNPDAHPAIVGRGLWEAAQLNQPAPPRGDSGPALLAGLIRCAGCQRAMSPRRRSYNCTSDCEARASIDRARVEPYVERVVLGHLARLRFAGESRRASLDAAMRSLADAEAELEAFQEATRVSGVGVEVFAEGLRSRVAAVEAARVEVGRTRGDGRTQVAGVLDLWQEWDVERRRQVLRGLLDVVWVRSANRRRLPIRERVKLIEAGYGPPGLSRMGVRAPDAEPLVWEAMPGEVAIPVEDAEDD